MKPNTFTGTSTNDPRIFGTRTAAKFNRGLTIIGIRVPNLVVCLTITLIILIFAVASQADSNDLLPIGQVQGRGSESPLVGKTIHIRGIVVGLQEDENERGARFYSGFIQDVPGSEDGDPATSDGIALFFGPEKPAINIGDILDVRGRVIEYYGLTEIDFRELKWEITAGNQVLPQAIIPNNSSDSQDFPHDLEKFEGMLISLPEVRVVGPTHEACGIAVTRLDTIDARPIMHQEGDEQGHVINVLHSTDVDCGSFPLVNYGDKISGLWGPLTYHFGQYKLVNQLAGGLSIKEIELPDPPRAPVLNEGQISLATFNLDEYFDSVDDSGSAAEPKLDSEDLAVKQEKIAATISAILGCPTIIGVQEVENDQLLEQLSDKLQPLCDFKYQVSHVPAPDARGSDLGLLNDPKTVIVQEVSTLQGCTRLDTGISDAGIGCPDGQQPLFSRPPLLVDVMADGKNISIIVNHFKSKRGGAAETHERRMAQAEHLHDLVQNLLAGNDDTQVAVIGDFNDYYGSPVKERLTQDGILNSSLDRIPVLDQYSYIFDGYSQLIDWILLSPGLDAKVTSAQIYHINADYNIGMAVVGDGASRYFRSSDHDVPMVILQLNDDRILEQFEASPEPTGNGNQNLQDQRPTIKPQVTTTFVVDTSASMQSIVTTPVMGLVSPEPNARNNEFRAQAQAGSEDSSVVGHLPGLLIFTGIGLAMLIVVKVWRNYRQL